jgi:hypothetical protein
MVESNPLGEVLRQQVGLEAFALDGDVRPILEPWSDRPQRARTPMLAP